MKVSRIWFLLFGVILFVGCNSDNKEMMGVDPMDPDQPEYYLTADIDGVEFEAEYTFSNGAMNPGYYSISIGGAKIPGENSTISIFLNMRYSFESDPTPRVFDIPCHTLPDLTNACVDLEYIEDLGDFPDEYRTRETPNGTDVILSAEITEMDFKNDGYIIGEFSGVVFFEENSGVTKKIENGRFFVPLEVL